MGEIRTAGKSVSVLSSSTDDAGVGWVVTGGFEAAGRRGAIAAHRRGTTWGNVGQNEGETIATRTISGVQIICWHLMAIFSIYLRISATFHPYPSTSVHLCHPQMFTRMMVIRVRPY